MNKDLTNLNNLAEEVCIQEAGIRETNIAQVKDCIAALGAIFRSVSFFKALSIAIAIRNRAGKR
jgi:hypothetical protein